MQYSPIGGTCGSQEIPLLKALVKSSLYIVNSALRERELSTKSRPLCERRFPDFCARLMYINRLNHVDLRRRESTYTLSFLLTFILKSAFNINEFISIGIFAFDFIAQPSEPYGNLATYQRRKHATFQNNFSFTK